MYWHKKIAMNLHPMMLVYSCWFFLPKKKKEQLPAKPSTIHPKKNLTSSTNRHSPKISPPIRHLTASASGHDAGQVLPGFFHPWVLERYWHLIQTCNVSGLPAVTSFFQGCKGSFFCKKNCGREMNERVLRNFIGVVKLLIARSTFSPCWISTWNLPSDCATWWGLGVAWKHKGRVQSAPG